MPFEPLPPVRHHLLRTLTLVYGVTLLTVVLVVLGFFLMHPPPSPNAKIAFEQNLVQHFQWAAKQIGMPPEMEKAGQIAKDLSIDLRIEGPGMNWASDPGLPAIRVFSERSHEPTQDAMAGRLKGRLFVLITRGEFRYCFVFPGNPFSNNFPIQRVLLLVAVVAAILAASYFAVNRLMQPIRLLMQGVAALEKGDLDYRITLSQRQDEFKSLAEAFNRMARSVRSMIDQKQRLLLDVSHELRGPLTRMGVALRMAPSFNGQEAALKAAGEMEAMIAEILETQRLLSGPGSLKRTRFDLMPLIKELRAQHALHKPGIQMIKAPARFHMLADADRMKTVLGNVLENALKYSEQQARKVQVELSHDKQHWKICIQDHGIGIPSEDLPHVLEPFYRVDRSRTKSTGGYGLGLSLCREIMRAHDGEILLSSQKGRGTLVTLLFPKPLPEDPHA
jgi:signal transduction histidine kinase